MPARTNRRRHCVVEQLETPNRMPNDPRPNLDRSSHATTSSTGRAASPATRTSSRDAVSAVVCLVLLATAGGCQFGPSVERHQLIQHQALIDFSGLKPPEAVEAVRMQASPPASWALHGVERKALYNHQQWKSPTARTGIGVVYARLPLPLSVDTLLWFGRQQYSKQGSDAKDLGSWTDAVGRKWFEVETNKYHARGYAIADGLDAWIVYMGYKTDVAPEPADISLAARCVEMFVPVKTGERFTVPPSSQKVTPVADQPAGPSTKPVAMTQATSTRPGPNQAGSTTQPVVDAKNTIPGSAHDGSGPVAPAAPAISSVGASDDTKGKAANVLQFLSQKWSGESAAEASTPHR